MPKKAEEPRSSVSLKHWRRPFSLNCDLSSLLNKKVTKLSFWIFSQSFAYEIQRFLTAVDFENQIFGCHFPDVFYVFLVLLKLDSERRPYFMLRILFATLSSICAWTMMTKCRLALLMNFFQMSA